MKNKKLRILSLFDGISGARQALKELNIECDYYASEIDKWAMQVSKKNHPDIFQLGDVKEIKPSKYSLSWVENEKRCRVSFKKKSYTGFDLLIGGFPCQSFSIAGNRKGLEDDRGQLFFDLLRILDQVKPKYFLFENVFSMGKANKDFIDEKLGIGHIMINSALLTAQCRKRIYWVGKLVNGKYEQVKIDQPEGKEIYLKDIIEDNVDDKYFIRNATFTPANGNAKKNTSVRVGHFNKGGQGDRVYSIEGKSICLSATSGGLGSKTGLYAIAQRGRYENGKVKQKLETSYSEKANALTTVQKDSLLLDLNHYNIRKPTPTECERLQGYEDNYTEGISNSQRYKSLGNSFTVPVIKHILNHIY
jgi:DNA-cytosine methyltransferase